MFAEYPAFQGTADYVNQLLSGPFNMSRYVAYAVVRSGCEATSPLPADSRLSASDGARLLRNTLRTRSERSLQMYATTMSMSAAIGKNSPIFFCNRCADSTLLRERSIAGHSSKYTADV